MCLINWLTWQRVCLCSQAIEPKLKRSRKSRSRSKSPSRRRRRDKSASNSRSPSPSQSNLSSSQVLQVHWSLFLYCCLRCPIYTIFHFSFLKDTTQEAHLHQVHHPVNVIPVHGREARRRVVGNPDLVHEVAHLSHNESDVQGRDPEALPPRKARVNDVHDQGQDHHRRRKAKSERSKKEKIIHCLTYNIKAKKRGNKREQENGWNRLPFCLFKL